MLDRANSGPEPSGDILRAILHGVAAGACEVAARETGSAYWAGMAADQRAKASARLHHAASARAMACEAARTSRVTPSSRSLE